MKAKLEYLIKHNGAVQWLYRHVMSALFRLIGIFIPIDENAVLLNSFSGKKFNDSPKVLFEEMLAREDCNNLHYIWAFNHPEDFDIPQVNKVKMDSWAYWKACLSTKYWITNVNIERGLSIKKSGTVYVNTWHGSGMKVSGNSVSGRSDYDFSSVDVFTSDGPLIEQIMIKSFNARPSSFLRCGRPREDSLYALRERGSVQEIKGQFGIDPKKKLVLYAPTWRESTNHGASFDEKPPMDVEKWKRVLGDEFIIGIRAHSITTNIDGIAFDDRIRDYSDENDLNRLLFATDVLISDYSGILMDYAILGRPTLGFVYDFKEYSKSRGIYFDPREYLTMFEDEDSLLDYILQMDYSYESEKATRYFETFAGFGGNAAATTIDRMLQIGLEKK